MKIVMLAVHDDGKKLVFGPGDVTDAFDDAEAQRLISVGGARRQTADEIEAEQEAAKAAAEAAAEAATAAAAAAAAADAAKKK